MPSHLVVASPRSSSYPPASPLGATPLPSPYLGPASARRSQQYTPLQQSLMTQVWKKDEKTRCEHVDKCITESVCLETIAKPDSWCCVICESTNAVRMCLSCGQCVCERHSYQHFETHLNMKQDHTLFLQINDAHKPVFCYSCRVIVRNDNDLHNIDRIRGALEDVQSLNIDVLSLSTPRATRRRAAEASSSSANAVAAAAVAASIARAEAASSSNSSGGIDVVMTPIEAESDALPAVMKPSLVRQRSSSAIWQKTLPFLSKKAQAIRAGEDLMRTALFRWTHRKLIQCFNSWKFVVQCGKAERAAAAGSSSSAAAIGAGSARPPRARRPGPNPSPRSSPRTGKITGPAMEDVIITSFDLSKAVPEGNEEEEEEEAERSAKKRKLIEGLPPLAPPSSDKSSAALVLGEASADAAAAAPSTTRSSRSKRSRSEERHPPTPSIVARSKLDGEPEKAADDLLSPKTSRARKAASTRVSPKGSRAPSPKPGAKPNVNLKLTPGVMGLRNLGNTCYLNSVIQAFSLTRHFRCYYTDCIPKLLPPLKHDTKKLLNARSAKSHANAALKRGSASRSSDSSDEESSSGNSDEDDEDEDDDHQSLSRDVSDLLATIWKGQRIMYTPDHFLQTVWTLYERFAGFKQQDAQEFVLFLLNQLSKEQETQMPLQRLDEQYQNPSLQAARVELDKLTISEKNTNQPSTGLSGKKRKNNASSNDPSASDAEMDDSSSQPTSRRRSNRSSTIVSTTSSDSLEALANSSPIRSPTGSSSNNLNFPSSSVPYNVPLPPSSLASIVVRTPLDAPPPYAVPRVIMSRPNDFITQNFAGVIRSEIKCEKCGKISATENEFLGMISVQIPPKSFLESEEDNAQPAADVRERSAVIHHSTSVQQLSTSLAGGSQSSLPPVAPNTFLSVSRSLRNSHSEMGLSDIKSHGSVTPSAVLASPSPSPMPVSGLSDLDASISARARSRHDKTREVPLTKCLAFTFNTAAPEVMDGVNAYSCANCKRKVRATKSQVLQAVPPQYLFVHISRTVYDSSSFSSKKDQTHITFPLHDLDMSPFLPLEYRQGGYLYELYAVVNHHGRGLNEGHFTATVRHLDKDPDIWLLCNDARVTVVQPEHVITKDAYLLFYSRQKAPSVPRNNNATSMSN